ncbi:MAG: hypothetical protein Fur0018_13570 [Anaerolineales bacterium]
MKIALRIAKVLLLMFVLFAAACNASPQSYPPPASSPEPYPMSSAAPCADWPAALHLRLRPENGRYLITLEGLPPDIPFSLRYTVQRGDFTAEQAFDGRAGADGAYQTYSLTLPPPATPAAYPAPKVVLDGEAAFWHFTLQQAGEAYCMEIFMIP